MKLIKVLMGIVVVVLVVVLAGRNAFLKYGVQTGIKKSLGVDITVDAIDAGILSTDILVSGLTVMNPLDGGQTVLAVVPRIYVDYTLEPLLQRRVECREVEIHVGTITITRKSGWDINLLKLHALMKLWKREKKLEKETWPLHIDTLVVTIDQVVYERYTRRGKMRKSVIPLHVQRERYENVTSIDEVVRLIILKALVGAGLQDVEMALDVLSSDLKDIGGAGLEALHQLEKKAGKDLDAVTDKAKQLFDSLRGSSDKNR